ncbi:MAG TPA: DUF4261 domain-containing protein [Candidatus Limnocylindrales bacterium]|nr:DUF4261 domain-containing protein [Candidatus Limnocylindrales bacterium]
MSETGTGILAAELRWVRRPALDVAELLPRIAALAGTPVEHVPNEAGNAVDQFRFPALRTELGEGSIEMQVIVARPDADPSGPLPPGAFLHSWDWPEAATLLAGATDALLVTDLMASGVTPRPRLRAWHAVLRAIVEAAPPAGIHLRTSDRVVSSGSYLAGLEEEPTGFSVLLNLRRFHVDEATGEAVFDTLGLAPFGLPDIQLHFRDLDHEAAARWTRILAWYVYANGDVIEDGHAVSGVDAGEQWPCRHEIGMADPERVVLDVDPSPHGPDRETITGG